MKANKTSFNKTAAAQPSRGNHSVLCILALCAALGAARPGMAQPPLKDAVQALPVIEVYKSPECGCCTKWAEHLRKNGFTVNLHDVNDVPAAREKLGMPGQYGSCHTAQAGQYLIEGHVPAADIKRLLKEHPKAIGLAVPAMPQGSPGMESDTPVPYDSLLISPYGSAKVFAHH